MDEEPILVDTANHNPPPIATASGGFSSSFLRRQRKDSSSDSSTDTTSSTSLPPLLPRPLISNSPDTTPPRSIVTSASSSNSSPIRRKPLPGNAAPVILSRLSQSSLPLSPSATSTAPSSPALPPPLPPPVPSSAAAAVASSSKPQSPLPPPPPPPPPLAVAAATSTPSYSITSSRQLETVDELLPFVPRDLDRYPRGQSPRIPHPIDTSVPYRDQRQIESESQLSGSDDDDYLPHGTHVHSRLSSEPIIPVLRSPPPVSHKRAETMALQPPQNRPPPLQIDSNFSTMPGPGEKQAKNPGNKITSFFGWKTTASPGAESSSTEISDSGRSPLPSPLPQSASAPSFSSNNKSPGHGSITDHNIHGFPLPPAHSGSISGPSSGGSLDLANKVSELEAELREISSELAGSIRREMELEDLVERFQLESHNDPSRRTSDYFSDSGTSSIRTGTDGGKIEDIERLKRAAEQERAQLKVELSQKWQEERSRRTACESHVQILENQVQQFRAQRVDNSNLSSKTKELETALEDTRRKLMEERQLKDNFEDLLTAMRVELEQLRNERDHFRDAQQKSRFQSIAEEDGFAGNRGSIGGNRGSMVGLSRSNSLARMPRRSSMAQSGGLSRSNSVTGNNNNRTMESRESLADRVKDTEAQRDALHQALKSLLDRQSYQARENQKRIKIMEMELKKAQDTGSPRKLGYEREVRNLREEINTLRRRAEEALEQKWQCEKGLGGLKMDLDRAEQETSSLRMLLQEHDIALPTDMAANEEGLANMQATSSSLESAYQQLQADVEHAEANANASGELSASVSRASTLSGQVREQLDTNNALRQRLSDAIFKGEREQKMSAMRINEMQSRLKSLEDTLMEAQHLSEDEMAKHEEEVRSLKESHNAQLMRAKVGIKTPVSLSPNPGTAPFGGARSPRLDVTTSGEGMPLSQAVQVEKLEARVKELEKALRDADFEMEEVVQRMNKAQIEVAELQSDRDEALRQTRRLEAAIIAERNTVKTLMN